MWVFLEFLGAALAANFVQSVVNKILVDRAAEAVERKIVKPALEYVKTTEFWDRLDLFIAEGMTLSGAFERLVEKPTAQALDYVFRNFSNEKHRAKYPIGNFLSLED